MALPKLNDTPKYELTIPSTGKKVRYRPYLVKEEKVLMLAMESGDPKQAVNAIVDTILACIDDSTLKRSTLKTFDVEYMFIQIRSKSVGETSNFSLKCKKCETANEVSVNLQSIEIKKQENNDIIELNDQYKLKMQYPNYELLSDIDFENTSETEQSFYIITKCIHSILTEEEAILASDYSYQELSEFIESLNGEQFRKIKNFIDLMPKLNHEVTFNCKSCNEQNTYKMEGIQDFF